MKQLQREGSHPCACQYVSFSGYIPYLLVGCTSFTLSLSEGCTAVIHETRVRFPIANSSNRITFLRESHHHRLFPSKP